MRPGHVTRASGARQARCPSAGRRATYSACARSRRAPARCWPRPAATARCACGTAAAAGRGRAWRLSRPPGPHRARRRGAQPAPCSALTLPPSLAQRARLGNTQRFACAMLCTAALRRCVPTSLACPHGCWPLWGSMAENSTSLREAAQMVAARPPLLIGHAVRGAGCTPRWAPAWPGTRTAGRSPRSPAMAQWLRWCALRRLAPRPPWPPCPPQVTERATAGRHEVAAAGCVTLSVALCNTRASPGLQHRLPRVLLGPPAGTHG